MPDRDTEETRLTERLNALLSETEAVATNVRSAMHSRIAVPDGWNMIPLDKRPAKEQITLRLDADVLAFFRDTGAGWGDRLNAVLQLYMGHREEA